MLGFPAPFSIGDFKGSGIGLYIYRGLRSQLYNNKDKLVDKCLTSTRGVMEGLLPVKTHSCSSTSFCIMRWLFAGSLQQINRGADDTNVVVSLVLNSQGTKGNVANIWVRLLPTK